MYHSLFDDALKHYNENQTRADRRIVNYYEKIRNSKQEKPFHEIILQSAIWFNEFRKWNGLLAQRILTVLPGLPRAKSVLKVFSAIPHGRSHTIYTSILFPLQREQAWTRYKGQPQTALANQGFKGAPVVTEWNQWVSSEKEALAVFGTARWSGT